MRFLLTVGVIGLVASQTLAAPGDGKKPDRQPNPERMQKILEKFDADGDGKLSAEERQAARQARQGDRPNQGQARRGQARRPGGQGPGGRAQADGPTRAPAALFKRADTDGNNQLSKQEFTQLMQRMRQGRQQAENAGSGPEARERGPRREGDRGPGARERGPRRGGERGPGARERGPRREGDRGPGARERGPRREGDRDPGARDRGPRREGDRGPGARERGPRREGDRGPGARGRGDRAGRPEGRRPAAEEPASNPNDIE